MSELLYLFAAVVISVVGVVLLRMRHDSRPKTLEGTIDQFSRGLEALAPDKPVRTKSSRRPRRPLEGENVG